MRTCKTIVVTLLEYKCQESSEEATSGLSVGNKRADLPVFCDEASRSSESRYSMKYLQT